MKNWIFLLIAVIMVIGLWAGSGYLLINNPDRGTIGDMFGAINSLFSGLAFAGLIYTIVLQKSELELQRKELELTRDELRGQKEAMQLQNDQLSHQAFESTFFQMVRLHNELLNSIDFTSGGGDKVVRVQSGSDCFLAAWSMYKTSFQEGAEQNDQNIRREQITIIYSRLWNQYESEFGHYFRSLYNIIKFVHKSNIKNKKSYTDIVRAQLSGQELLIIFYNIIYNKDLKFKLLIEEYSLLKHIPYKAIPSELDFEFYNPNAFGKQISSNGV